MRRAVAATAMISALALGVRAQPPRENPTSTFQGITISGRVVADETGDAVPNARVTLTTVAQGTPVVLTDGDGRFALSAAPGRYSVAAGKTGYARTDVALTAGGQPVEIRLQRGATISGRVVDEFGDPVVSTRVAAETRSSGPAGVTIVATTDTDDRGEYRLAGLPGCPPRGEDCPGRNFVIAVTTLGPPTSRALANNQIVIDRPRDTTYYPGVAAVDDAQWLRLQSGEDRSGIDFVVSADQTGGGEPFSLLNLAGPLSGALAAGPGSRASGIIRGRVVSTQGRALPHAQVMLLLENDFRQSRAGRADADGRFAFEELAAGKYRAVASKSGYAPVPSEPGHAGLPLLNSGRTVDLAEGETRDRVDISLERWGTLSGRVVDELGDPVQGARVQVLQVRYEAGRRRLAPAGFASRLTDDLGRYRLYAIEPGQYVVSATVGGVASVDLPGYTQSYFPGTPNAVEAQFVSIPASQDVTGVDFPLSRIRTARVAGKMLNAAGEPTMGGTVRLTPSQRSASMTSVPVGARILPDGRFEFPNVPPGQYVVMAFRGRSPTWTEGEFGAMPVSVNGADVTGLVLQTSAGSSIAGHFTFDVYDRSKTPPRSAIELSPMPIDLDLSPPDNFAIADIREDWSFEMAGVNGPRRLQLLRAPPGWALKEIVVNGIDVTDRPLPFGRRDQSLTGVDVVLTDRISELTGAIADDRGRPAPGSSLIVFSTDRGRWYHASRFLRKVIAGPDGAFRVAGLPTGTYYAAAVARLPVDGEDGWEDPAFLDSLTSRASTATVGDGQKLTLSLRMPPR